MIARLHLVTNLNELGRARFVIEAASEEVPIKHEVYRKIEPFLSDDAVLATNTSSLSIDELSRGAANRGRFVGRHFFNPPEVLRLVEIKRCDKTSQDTLDTTCAMALRLDRRPMVVPDEPGYYVNRLLFPLIIEGIRVLELSGGNSKDIDDAMKLGANLPMGPLEFSDYIGNDIVMDICRTLYHRRGESKFEPPGLLARMVEEGELGRKTGKGFHKY